MKKEIGDVKKMNAKNLQISLDEFRLQLEQEILRMDFEETMKELKERFREKEKDRKMIALLFRQLGSISELCSVIHSLYSLIESAKEESKKPTYVMSSLFLLECYEYLNKENSLESLHLVSGIQLGNMNVLDRMLPIALEKQTSASVSADPISLRDTLIQLDTFGHKLLAYFHIHPGAGKHCTFPSYNDLEIQRMLERGKYPAIGAIFSRNGYIRFFPQDKDFEILVYGKGVEKEDDKVFKLVQQVQDSEKIS